MTTNDATELVERIAKGLTKAMRESLMRKPCPSVTKSGNDKLCMPLQESSGEALARRGLLSPHSYGPIRSVTPLGLAVRNYLKENPGHE